MSVDPQQDGGAAPPLDRAAYGSWTRRAVAILVDLLVPAIAWLVAVALVLPAALFPDRTGRSVLFGLQLAAVAVAVLFLFWNSGYRQGRTGQSLGKRALGIRLVRERDGRPAGFGRALLRLLLHSLDVVPMVVGYLRPLWHARRQTFTDSLLGTVVVRAGP